MSAALLNRREFVIGTAATGVGLSVGMALPLSAKAAQGTPEVNAWVVIDPDDTVTIRIARTEMGQGTATGLAQLVAEELGCDWHRVTWEYPTPGDNLKRDRVWGSFSTGGSRGIRSSHQYVREGGATARLLLTEAAANAMGVPASECVAENSRVTHAASGRSKRFGEVATAAAKLPPPLDVTLKTPEEWQLIGKPVARIDTRPKLDGSQVYGADVNLPGMLDASIKACPVFGGKLKGFDASSIEGRRGVVRAVAVGDDAVAVVADTWWRAKTALDALHIEWDYGPNAQVSSASIDATLDEGLDADDAFVGNQQGDVAAGLNAAEQTITATYAYPFQNHAPLEPMNTTARVSKDRCEVWCPTQNGEAALAAAAEASGLPQTQCEAYKLSPGGGFGRRGAFHDFVHQAVLIAKQFPDTPVKLLWTREEDMAQGRFHPVTKARLSGGLDKNGKLSGLRIRISGQSILAAVFPGALRDGADPATFQCLLPGGEHAFTYSVDDLLIDHAMRNPHVPPGFWRGVNVNQNVIYVECFLDELAHAAGRDPLEFRHDLLEGHPLARAVLDAAAERAGWGEPLPEGHGRGLAVCKAFDSYVAACAEVSVENGKLRMHKITAATDPGVAVNPQQIEAQVAGSFVYGLSAMLYGKCTVKDGAIVESNFNNYPSMRLAEMPEVETIVMPSGGFWGGVGEPTIAVAAPAVLNAIFAATGKRIRDLPIGDQALTA
ncbi:MAG: molybdopterin cofactor-binding domain-containing protein [Pseudomonadota bacterium]